MNNIYAHAVETRINAERTCIPEEFEKIAVLFEYIGYIASAKRCRDRARHYWFYRS